MTKSKHDDETARRLAAKIEARNLRRSKLNLKIEPVAPFLDRIPKRLRALNPEKVDKLAESMAEIGLLNPITVWSSSEGDYEVVAGAHRVAAAIKLDWDTIAAVFVDDWTDIDRQLWEIDENLIRAELSPTEMAEHLTRREELWGARQVSAQVAPKPQGGRPKGFAGDTAEKTGISKSTVNRATSRAKAIPEDVREKIKGTKLDTGAYLDSLKGMEPDEQRAQVKADLAEPSVQQDAQIRAANRATAAVGKPLRDVQLTWRRASAEDRRRIKAWVNEQIIDDEAKVALIDNHNTVDACAATGGRATEFVSP